MLDWLLDIILFGGAGGWLLLAPLAALIFGGISWLAKQAKGGNDR